MLILFIVFTLHNLHYRLPLRVKETRKLGTDGKCNMTIEREYQSFCDRCGQRLNWDKVI